MMMREYQNRYDVKPTSEVDVYCKLEGVSPLFIYRTAEKEVYPRHKVAGRSLKSLFTRWMGFVKHFKFNNSLSPGRK